MIKLKKLSYRLNFQTYKIQNLFINLINRNDHFVDIPRCCHTTSWDQTSLARPANVNLGTTPKVNQIFR